MYTAVAFGKISSEGTILKATPGITITSGSDAVGEANFKVNLPDRLVNDANYIVQLTVQNSYSDGDWDPTIIGLMYQDPTGFEIQIWSRNMDTDKPFPSYGKADWHFVVYDL